MVLFSAAGAADAELTADDIEMARGHHALHASGAARDEGEPQEVVVRSKLLGRHNVANLLAAARRSARASSCRSTRSAARWRG